MKPSSRSSLVDSGRRLPANAKGPLKPRRTPKAPDVRRGPEKPRVLSLGVNKGFQKRVAADLRDLRQEIARMRTAILAPSLADFDPDRIEDLDLFEAQRCRTAAGLLRREMRSLRSRGLIDDDGNRVRKELPADMREDSACDL